MTESDAISALQKLVEDFSECARKEFDERIEAWRVDLARNEVHEVLGALLSRQTTLALELANCPAIWNGHIAPLVLRAMADVYITIAWVLRDPMDRSLKFIHYGLGQAKLQLEHRRAELETRAAKPHEYEYVSAQENWINRQRATFLTDVNLGSWSGLSTRSMAEEANCLDFYNYVYTPFSACAHSMWHHISIYNLQECKNPLHRYHSVPRLPEGAIDTHYLYLGAKYLQKTFATFDDTLGLKIRTRSAFDLLCDGLEFLNSENSGDDDTCERA